MKVVPSAVIPIGYDELSAIAKKLTSGEVLNGPDIRELVLDFERLMGHGRAFASNFCRTALLVGLMALGLRPGDEVLAPAYTCSIVFEIIMRAGLRPVLADVDPRTYDVNPEALKKAVGSRTRAILVAYMFGCPCNMEPIMELAEDKGLYVIEDVAQALGATYRGRKLGSFGDLAAFSFGPGKVITWGNGGILLVNNPELLDTVEELWARLPGPTMMDVGGALINLSALLALRSQHLSTFLIRIIKRWVNRQDLAMCHNCLVLARRIEGRLNRTIRMAKMPNLCASVIRIQLRKLDKLNRRRVENAEAIMSILADVDPGLCELPEAPKGTKPVFTRFIVKVPANLRHELGVKMLERGVDTDRPYWYLSTLLRVFGHFPIAMELSDRLLALPNSPTLSAEEAAWIAEEFLSLLREHKGV